MTDVIDLETGRIIYVANGKGGAAIIPFLERLKRRRNQVIEGIAMDMSVPYTCAVRDTLPGIPIVYDRFHVIQKMNESLDKLRRQLMSSVAEPEKKLVKGVRYLLLMGEEKLDEAEANKPGSKQRLQQALALNEPLNMGYYLKEKLRHLWEQNTDQHGKAFLQEWCQEAFASGVLQLKKMANTLLEHETGILNYF